MSNRVVTYYKDQQLPNLEVAWMTRLGVLLPLSSGAYVVTGKVFGKGGSFAIPAGNITKADTDPNATVAFDVAGMLSTLPGGEYTFELRAVNAAKTRIVRGRIILVAASP